MVRIDSDQGPTLCCPRETLHKYKDRQIDGLDVKGWSKINNANTECNVILDLGSWKRKMTLG